MWGMQMVGSDICGFGSNTTVELCSRWFQLGVLYPFARNHNTLRAHPQEPYAMGETVLKAAQKGILLRYSLLNYFYSLFIKNRLSYIWQPLFMQYFGDENNFRDDVMNTQFLIGANLMAAPILEPGTTERQAYFPAVNWYSL
jgi:alpha-glucosidase/lysosomal alpha-glucosidase